MLFRRRPFTAMQQQRRPAKFHTFLNLTAIIMPAYNIILAFIIGTIEH
jgi:hypothetical protein